MSGLKLTAVMPLVWPENRRSSWPELMSHNTDVRSVDPLSEYLPQDETFRDVIGPVWPF